MKALEIRLNGELKLICGTEDLDSVMGLVRGKGKLGSQSSETQEPDYYIECFGSRQNSGNTEVLKWVNTPLSINDEITFRFIETDDANPPIDSQIIDDQE